MTKWIRLKTKSDVGGNSGVRRCYGQDGNPYPRIVLSVIPSTVTSIYSVNIPRDDRPVSLLVGFSIKKKREGIWENCFLPIELAGDLAELLNEAKCLIAETSGDS